MQKDLLESRKFIFAEYQSDNQTEKQSKAREFAGLSCIMLLYRLRAGSGLFLVTDPGGFEGGHPADNVFCRIDQVKSKRGSGAFSDTHIQLQQRLFP